MPTTTVRYTEQLADYVTSLRFEDLPEATIAKSKQCLLDLLGIMVRAKVEADSSPAIEASVEALCRQSGPCTAVGRAEGLPAHYAALLNGTYGHSLDFDDTHALASLHPGAPVIPVILALAEEAGVDGRKVITAMVAGYEITVRVSLAAGPKALYDRGFHPTAVAGTFGATAAGASLLGFDAAKLVAAFGINNSQAAGSMQYLANGSWNKRFHIGFAAHNAIVSLVMADNGVIGAAHPLEGLYGFINGYAQQGDPALLTRGLGDRFAIDETALKPYPSCRFTHGPIDLLIDMVHGQGIDVDDVERITIGMCAKGIDLVGAPQEQKRRPQNVVDGQFSMHFTGAVAARYGRMAWSDYAHLGDPELESLMDRIEVVHDQVAEDAYPAFLWRVSVKERNGRTHERINDCAKGEPGNPMTWEETVAKFHDLAAAALDEKTRAQVVDQVASLENVKHLGDIMRLLR